MATFGPRFFGRRFFGPRFFGVGGDAEPSIPPAPPSPLFIAGITDRTSLIVNDVDLSRLGVIINRTEGLWDSGVVAEGLTAVPDRAGHMWDGSTETDPRVISVTGWLRARTRAELVDNADAVARLLDQATLECVFVDWTTVLFHAKRSLFRCNPHSPQKRSVAARFELVLTAADILAHEISERVYAIGAFRTPIPLGTGWSPPVIRAIGPGENPRAIYRSITGEIMGQAGCTVALEADQYTEIICQQKECWLYEAGEDPVRLPLDDDCNYFALDGRDGRPADGHWGTIEQNLAGELQVRRTFV